VITTVSDPPDGETSRASVLGLHVVAIWATAGLRCVLGLAAVDAQVTVTETTTLAHVQDGIGDTVNAEVGDLGLASCAATELSTSDDGNRAEDV
jgi:hypothetical protein